MADRETKEHKLLAPIVEAFEELSRGNPGGFTGAPDMSHEPRSEERKD